MSTPEHGDGAGQEQGQDAPPELPPAYPTGINAIPLPQVHRKIPLKSEEAKKAKAKEAIGSEMNRLGNDTGTVDFANPIESWDAGYENPDALFTDLLMKLTSKHDELGEQYAKYKGRGVANGMYITDAKGKRVFVQPGDDQGTPASYTAVRSTLANAAIKHVRTRQELIKSNTAYEEFKRNGIGYLGPKAGPRLGTKLRVGDVAGAYLLAKLGGPPVFVRVKREHIPEEHRAKWETMQDPVARVRNALYGMQRSMGDWKLHLEDILIKDMGFSKIESEDSVYTKGDIVITVYVDDIMMDTGGDLTTAEIIRKHIERILPIKFKFLHDDPRFLGIHIDVHEEEQGNITIKFNQTEYANKIVTDFEQSKGNTVHNAWTPMVEHMEPPKNMTDEDLQKPGKYAKSVKKTIGALLHLQRCTRGDIAYATGLLARHVTKWTVEHDMRLERLVGYVKATSDIALTWELKSNDKDFKILTFVDSDFAGDATDSKSTSGYITVLVGQQGSWLTLDWGSKKQSVVTKATGEAEIIALLTGLTRSGYPTALFFEELNSKDKFPLSVITDSSAAKMAVKNPIKSKMKFMKKSCRVSLAWLNDQVQRAECTILQCETRKQLADMGTKPLPRPQFEILREKCGWKIHKSNDSQTTQHIPQNHPMRLDRKCTTALRVVDIHVPPEEIKSNEPEEDCQIKSKFKVHPIKDNFLPSKVWAGCKPGMTFKMDVHGLGYYADTAGGAVVIGSSHRTQSAFLDKGNIQEELKIHDKWIQHKRKYTGR